MEKEAPCMADISALLEWDGFPEVYVLRCWEDTEEALDVLGRIGG